MERVVYVTDPAAVPESIPGDTLYLDTETHAGEVGRTALDPLTNVVRLIQLTGEVGPVYVFDMLHVPVERLLHLFRPDATWCGHNLGFDLAALHRIGVEYPTKLCCTLVASQVLMNGLDPTLHGGHRLDECLRRYCEHEIVKDQGASDWSQYILTPEQITYAANDVYHLRALRAKLQEWLDYRRLTPVAQLEWDIIPAITQMGLTGIRVDRAEWTARAVAAEGQVEVLRGQLSEALPPPDAKAYRTVRTKKDGEPYVADVRANAKIARYNETRAWNWASWQQVLTAFARESVYLPNTSYDTIVENAHKHPALKLLLDFKDIEKESTTFGLDWLKHLRDGDRVHANWRQMGTRSGRMSCTDPNLQQIPRGRARKGIVASSGRVLVRADFSQIEARIAAKISGDVTLSRLFMERTGDIHRFTAGRVLGKAPEDVTAEDRQIGKSLLFGLLFGMGPEKLLVYCRTNYGVTLTPDEAVKFRARFFDVFPGLARWHRRVQSACEYKTECYTLLGRRRITSDETAKVTVYLNTPVQGTGADLLKLSVREVWWARHEWPGVNLIGLIHDEIICDVLEADAEAFAVWLKAIMIEVGDKLLSPIPTDADVKIGKAWGK